MSALWDAAVRAEGESRITGEISQLEDSCLLTLTHGQMREDANDQHHGGWAMILAGMNT